MSFLGSFYGIQFDKNRRRKIREERGRKISSDAQNHPSVLINPPAGEFFCPIDVRSVSLKVTIST